MGDGDPINMGVVNESDSETTLTKVPHFAAEGGNAIAFHVICQERVGVQGRAGVAWRQNHLPGPFGQGVVGIMGDGDPQDLLDAGVVGWSIDGNLGVYGNAGVFNKGIGVLGVSGVDNGGGGSQTFPAGVGGRGRSELGVHGVSDSGDGVRGDSATGIGVIGIQGAGVDPHTIGLFGVAGTSDLTSGVLGHSNSDAGVRGESVTGVGVFGTTEHGSAAVKGVCTFDIGVVGIQGAGVDPRTIGVFGVAGTSDLTPGVFGRSNGDAGVSGESVIGVGVLGKTEHGTAAVFGISDLARGVLGRSNTDTGVTGESETGVGVRGVSTDSYGVVGFHGDGLGPTPSGSAGVVGISADTPGVLGNSATGVGVHGISTTGVGVFGSTEHGSAAVTGSSGDSTGVQGNSVRGIGVFGLHGTSVELPLSLAGVVGSSTDTPGVLGKSSTDAGVRGESDSGAAIHGISTSSSGIAGQFDGNVVVNGDLNVTGAKSAVVQSRGGSFRRLYAMESPESWFEDFGTAQLEDGHAQVRLEPTYAALIRGDDYRVFLTPLGDCKGLYANTRSPQGFDVRELQGGTSCIKFDYRVVAKRADITAPRLERV